MFGGTVSLPFLICPKMCMGEDDPARGYIISTIFFVSGVVTLLQATFGVRYYYLFSSISGLEK
jgi:nucleobase transporter 1/2